MYGLGLKTFLINLYYHIETFLTKILYFLKKRILIKNKLGAFWHTWRQNVYSVFMPSLGVWGTDPLNMRPIKKLTKGTWCIQRCHMMYRPSKSLHWICTEEMKKERKTKKHHCGKMYSSRPSAQLGLKWISFYVDSHISFPWSISTMSTWFNFGISSVK